MGAIYLSPFCDENGDPVVRTKIDHPYNYDGFVQWRSTETTDARKSTIYSDRLFSQDHVRFNALCEKHFGNKGQYWEQRDPELIEAFLCDYFYKPDLKLYLIMEYCNQSSGYPYWRFDCVMEP